VGGYLGEQHRPYFESLAVRGADWGDRFEYVGSPATIAEKSAFFQSLDVLSVPTAFLEPKGLYVLEALANGVPVVQPAHGAFPELVERTGGGWLTPPGDAPRLAETLLEALEQHDERRRRAEAGYAAVRTLYSPRSLAEATLRTLRETHESPA
jgi:glycosyltransferase involved in cell wall biosynthesis